MNKRAKTVLSIVATDCTFKTDERMGGFVGKCIHCRSKLLVLSNGDTAGTIEHILPRTHGGDDRIDNLALACAACNHEKGVRHDARRRHDQGLVALVARLTEERKRRWRDRPDG